MSTGKMWNAMGKYWVITHRAWSLLTSWVIIQWPPQQNSNPLWKPCVTGLVGNNFREVGIHAIHKHALDSFLFCLLMLPFFASIYWTNYPESFLFLKSLLFIITHSKLYFFHEAFLSLQLLIFHFWIPHFSFLVSLCGSLYIY